MKREVKDVIEAPDSAGNRVKFNLSYNQDITLREIIVVITWYSVINWFDSSLNSVSFDVALSPV